MYVPLSLSITLYSYLSLSFSPNTVSLPALIHRPSKWTKKEKEINEQNEQLCFLTASSFSSPYSPSPYLLLLYIYLNVVVVVLVVVFITIYVLWA